MAIVMVVATITIVTDSAVDAVCSQRVRAVRSAAESERDGIRQM
jgi:hypothetical protein